MGFTVPDAGHRESGTASGPTLPMPDHNATCLGGSHHGYIEA